MSGNGCRSCGKAKCVAQCGNCGADLCKSCFQRLEENTFAFLDRVPPELGHTIYCPGCYVSLVSPALSEYEATLARARQVYVFLKNKSEQTRLFGRSEKPVKVDECEDKDQALLRLAFVAARGNFNVLLDVELNSKKVRNFGWQTMRWSAVGTPSRVDSSRLKDE